MSRSRLLLLSLILLAIGFLAGFATAYWLAQDQVEQARAEVAQAREAYEDAQHEADELADELDVLEQELWEALDEPVAVKVPEAKGLRGRVVGVADGDTITILDEAKTQHRVRLLGIDAPERRQPFSARAKEALSGKVFGQEVLVEWDKKDQYGRVLGDVKIDGRWINLELVREGHCWHFKKYDSRAELAKAEEEARKAKRGLWIEEKPEAPWDYRARMRKPRPPPLPKVKAPPGLKPDPPKASALTHWLNTKTNVRHNSTCRWFMNTKHGRMCRPDEGTPCGICERR